MPVQGYQPRRRESISRPSPLAPDPRLLLCRRLPPDLGWPGHILSALVIWDNCARQGRTSACFSTPTSLSSRFSRENHQSASLLSLGFTFSHCLPVAHLSLRLLFLVIANKGPALCSTALTSQYADSKARPLPRAFCGQHPRVPGADTPWAAISQKLWSLSHLGQLRDIT